MRFWISASILLSVMLVGISVCHEMPDGYWPSEEEKQIEKQTIGAIQDAHAAKQRGDEESAEKYEREYHRLTEARVKIHRK